MTPSNWPGPTSAPRAWTTSTTSVGDFFELHGDRCYADDGAIVRGIGHFRGIPVTMIAIEKGHSAKSGRPGPSAPPTRRGIGRPCASCAKAEKFHRPVLCFVDTSGAYCGIGAEERGQGQAIAANLMGMMALNTPIITTLIGEGGSGGPWPCRWPTRCGCWRTRCTP